MGIGLPKKMMMIWQTHCVEGKTSVNNIVNLLHRAELHYRQAPDPLGHILVVVDSLHQAQLLHLPPEASLPVNKASLYHSLVAKDLLQGVDSADLVVQQPVLRVDVHGGLVESLKHITR